MEKGVISSTGEKEHVETPSGRDVCQVPCHTTSSFLSVTFFRSLLHSHCNMSLEDGTAVWGFLGGSFVSG